MARHNPGQPAYEDPNLFTGGEIGAAESHPAKRGFWLSLFLAQPLLMLGGMWMLLVLIAVLAFGGLLDPGMKTLPKLTPLEQARLSRTQRPASTGDAQGPQPPNLAGTGLSSAVGPNVADNLVEANRGSNASGPSIPVWSLATLTLICAAGCWVIDHFLNAPPSAPVKKLRQPKPIQSNRPTLQTLKRLKPYLASPAPSLQTKGKMRRRLPSQPTPPHSTAPPPPDADPVVPSVVSPTESNSLDWPDGSLAHQLDLRQQKSLSSWL